MDVEETSDGSKVTNTILMPKKTEPTVADLQLIVLANTS